MSAVHPLEYEIQRKIDWWDHVQRSRSAARQKREALAAAEPDEQDRVDALLLPNELVEQDRLDAALHSPVGPP